MSTAADVFAGATNDRNPSAKFAAIGDTYQGTILRVGEYTGPNELKQGQVETSVSIDLELAAPVSGTDHQNQPFSFDVGDTVVIWARTHIEDKVAPNGLCRAIADGVRVGAGRPGLPEVGGQLAVRFDAVGTASKPGLNPPKQYVAQYRPPTATPASQQGGPFDQPANAPAPTTTEPPAPSAPVADDGPDLFA